MQGEIQLSRRASKPPRRLGMARNLKAAAVLCIRLLLRQDQRVGLLK
jgi:hypothetical protein